MRIMRSGFAVLLTLVVAGLTAYADDEPAVKPGPPPAALDATYAQINKYVLDTYVGTLPANWSTWTQRYNNKLDVNGNLCVAVDVMLASAGDIRLRFLSAEDVESYKCRMESGYVGVGVMFNFKVKLVQGIRIDKVLDPSPARDAGLVSGTTIVGVNGVRLGGSDLVDAIKLLLAKDVEVKLTVLDGDKESDVLVKRKEGDKLGIYFAPGKTNMTVTVGQVFSNSPAEKAGLRAGEVITKINNNVVFDGDPDWFVSQSGGRLGDEIGLTVVRDNAEVNLSVKRAVVVNPDLAFGFTEADGNATVRLTNLDWSKLTESLDRHVERLNQAACVVDLRGAAGENPELAARLAARFIQSFDQDLLCYSEKQDGKEKTTRYFVALRDCKSTLVSECGGVETVVEQSLSAVTAKLSVLVDEFTSGTAEALALALQRSGRATISGAATANRFDLVVTKIFESGESEIAVEVAAKRLVPGAGYKSLEVKPDQKTASAVNKGDQLAFLGVVLLGFAAFVGYSVIRGRQSSELAATDTGSTRSRTVKRIAFVVLGVVAAVAGSVSIYSGVHHVATTPRTEAQKASAYVRNILWTDEDTRVDSLQHAGVDRGKLDAQLKWGEEQPPIADAEVEAASRIVTAIADNDFETVRTLIVSYAYKPYARAQFASCLNHAFHKSGVNFYVTYHFGNFAIANERLRDGQARVYFTPLEAPRVHVMVVDPKYPRQYSSTENAAIFDANEVFATLRAPLIRLVQNHRAKPAK